MKTVLQLLACSSAIAGLLVGAVSHATNLAELPLRTAALAKPNVIFAMDDSGSMDWEVVLRTDSGIAWWRYDSTTGYGSAWDRTNNRPFENGGPSGFPGLTYNFPMGNGPGGALYSSSHESGGQIPPIAQLAWTRSSAFNPLYYNTKTTYPAWSPAYVGGALRTYENASTTAAPSHPGPLTSTPTSLNVGAEFNSGSTNWANSANTEFTFRAYAGMTLPAGTRANCGGTANSLSAAATVPAGWICRASIPYYPATFWQRTVCPAGDTSCIPAPDCVAENPNTNPTASCIASPDGLGKLRRYEIKSGNTFPSGRTHAEELQNFANWFTYYRKRKLMLAGAMGRVLESITGLRMGVVPFNFRRPVTMHDSDATSADRNRYAVAGRFYLNATPSISMLPYGTPTHLAMLYVGEQFNTNMDVVQHACQRNSMFVVTDGFSNTATSTPPAWDVGKSAATWGSGPPYQTTINGSLADLGLRFYTNRLRTDLPAGRVPPGDPGRRNPILNTDLHITTFGITLGARGTLYPTALDPFAVDVFANPPTWPTPVGDSPEMIDDLWHATINGRGRMYLANDVETMRRSIVSSLDEIANQQGAQSSVAVSAVNLDRSDSQAYLASYDPKGWGGDLTANRIDIKTGEVGTIQNWSAADKLAARDWTGRVVFTAVGGSGVDFSAANIGVTVNPAPGTYTDAQVVNYLRGDRTGEGDSVRQRTSLIGAVVNAEPVLAREEKMVYLASGNGMLHAFDAATGTEQWAFVPPDGLVNLGKSVQRGWVYQTLLDATPVVGQLSGGTKLLVGGMGAAGRAYYALDVSNPRGLTAAQAASQFRWSFPAAGDTTNRARMGFTIGKPVIVRTAAHGDVVLVTSGVDNGQVIGDGKGRLWMLNASTGAVIKTFRTTVGTTAAEAGLTQVSAFKESDGTVRYAYGGDLLGNLWKFDLATAGAGEHDATRVATLVDASGNAQPVTASPELIMIQGKRVVLVGTGRLLDVSDFGSTLTQTFYAIADTDVELPRARNGLVPRTYTRGAGGSGSLSGETVNWTADRGWYVDLPAGEQANTDPVVAYGAVGFVTNRSGANDCSEASMLYLIDIGTGLATPPATGDTMTASWLISNAATSSRLITLRAVNGRVIGTTHRSDNTVFQQRLPIGQVISPSKNAWREIRR
jgi:type IV pilus assembly protein PilY1